jgi:hypothetical protein
MARTGRPKAELTVTDQEEETLQRWARRPKALALRSKFVLACAEGKQRDRGRRARVQQVTVGRWRSRLTGWRARPMRTTWVGRARSPGAKVEEMIVTTIEQPPPGQSLVHPVDGESPARRGGPACGDKAHHQHAARPRGDARRRLGDLHRGGTRRHARGCTGWHGCTCSGTKPQEPPLENARRGKAWTLPEIAEHVANVTRAPSRSAATPQGCRAPGADRRPAWRSEFARGRGSATVLNARPVIGVARTWLSW